MVTHAIEQCVSAITLDLSKMDCGSLYTLLVIGLSSCVTLSTASSALILTPFINEKRLDVARNLSLVKPFLFLNLTSYSGFLTVDEKYNSNTFFWYFPAVGRPLNEAPLIIWLQGGPGASSLVGVFDEIGPFKYDSVKGLQLREWSWATEHSMLFIDNPIGAGFSFTNSIDGFAKNMSMYTNHLYNALSQFTTLFPEGREAPLFVSGESYAGRYVPALAVEIIRKPDKIVNLKGVMLGNPVLNRESVTNLTAVFYNWGLIDVQGVLATRPLQDAYAQAVRNGDNEAAYKYRDLLLEKLMDITEQQQTYNVLADEYSFHDFETYIRRSDVRQALHVGDIEFTFDNSSVKEHLIQDFLSEVSPKVEELLEKNCRVLIYCGQLDLTDPCVPNAAARRKNWHWSHRDSFLNAPRVPWWYNETVAGYVKSGGGFTEVLVRGAGHLVPLDKPVQTLKLVYFFIRDLDLPLPPNFISNTEDTPPLYKDLDKTPAPSGKISSQSDKTCAVQKDTNAVRDKTTTMPAKTSAVHNETSLKDNISSSDEISYLAGINRLPDKNIAVSNKTSSSTLNNTIAESDKNIAVPEKNSSTRVSESKSNVSTGLVTSVVINVILVLVIAALFVFYVRTSRRNEAFPYNNVDNLSDDIFLS